MLIKFLAVDVIAASVIATTNVVDGTFERIIVAGAVVTSLLLIWRNLVAPMIKILRRTVAAVEAFERLPGWMNDADEARASIEAEVALVHNGQKAIIRELGIEDQVRQMPPERWGIPPEPRAF